MSAERDEASKAYDEVWEGLLDAGLARSGSKDLIGIEQRARKKTRR